MNSSVRLSDSLLAVILSLILLLIYYPSLGGDYVWDDVAISQISSKLNSINIDNIVWIFSHSHAGHYQPVTWLSFMLENAVWGFDSTASRIINLLLHFFMSWLLYRFILLTLKLTNRDSRESSNFHTVAFIITVMYAIHPMRVETVAWITERRDLLSGVSYLLTLYLYLSYRFISQNRLLYITSLSVFVFSLLSKVWGITLPAVLFLLVFYFTNKHRSRFSYKQFILELFPFILLALVATVIAAYAQNDSGAALSWEEYGLTERLLQIGYSSSYYLFRILLPFDLSPLYPLYSHDFHTLSSLLVSLSGYIVIIYSVWAAYQRKALGIALLCYLAVISPISGILQSGPQLVADRYSYLSSIPIFILLAHVTPPLFQRLKSKTMFALLVLIILIFSYTTAVYSLSWTENKLLWTRAISVNTKNYPALMNRGDIYFTEGNYLAASADYLQATKASRSNARAHYQYAKTQTKLGNPQIAIRHYGLAIEAFPNYLTAYLNKAELFYITGNQDHAINTLKTAREIAPEYSEIGELIKKYQANDSSE